MKEITEKHNTSYNQLMKQFEDEKEIRQLKDSQVANLEQKLSLKVSNPNLSIKFLT